MTHGCANANSVINEVGIFVTAPCLYNCQFCIIETKWLLLLGNHAQIKVIGLVDFQRLTLLYSPTTIQLDEYVFDQVAPLSKTNAPDQRCR